MTDFKKQVLLLSDEDREFHMVGNRTQYHMYMGYLRLHYIVITKVDQV
jgi:hypothetical protein